MKTRSIKISRPLRNCLPHPHKHVCYRQEPVLSGCIPNLCHYFVFSYLHKPVRKLNPNCHFRVVVELVSCVPQQKIRLPVNRNSIKTSANKHTDRNKPNSRVSAQHNLSPANTPPNCMLHKIRKIAPNLEEEVVFCSHFHDLPLYTSVSSFQFIYFLHFHLSRTHISLRWRHPIPTALPFYFFISQTTASLNNIISNYPVIFPPLSLPHPPMNPRHYIQISLDKTIRSKPLN